MTIPSARLTEEEFLEAMSGTPVVVVVELRVPVVQARGLVAAPGGG